MKKGAIFVCSLLGNSPASEFYMPTFRNTLSVPSSNASSCKMNKFENSWVIHTGKGWLGNSLSGLEGGIQGRGESGYKAGR